MEEDAFKLAMANVLNNDYCQADLKIIKAQLKRLEKKESDIKKQIDKSKTDFTKKKSSLQKQLKEIKTDIKNINKIL